MIDYVDIFIFSGKGGDGAVAFRREKYVPRGGPSGGDGGDGGSVTIRSDASANTLIDFRYRHHFRAQPGGNGQKNQKTGSDGENLIIIVPPGTVVKTKDGIIIADLEKPGQEVMVAKGGKGGFGNDHFSTATMQTPRFAQKGTPGEEAHLVLELKLIADAGLVGYPNSGKSTLLSVISRSKPKIAPYPFTTLEPCLGLVLLDNGYSFTAADIPGLIEGAHKGRGLGDRFLRHIERTRVILHIVDLSEPDPIERYWKIREELAGYGCGLAEKAEIIVANKIDLPKTKGNITVFQKEMELIGKQVFPISALRREGLNPLLYATAEILRNSKT
ncbi:MAG: GTPase ObgE [Candidatus Omnitrophota bacterium]